MSASKRYRWACPVCGVGALGGKAPRRDATVRYCLPCSAKSDTLIERTCPALDKAREQRDERRRVKAAAKREREASCARGARERAVEAHRSRVLEMLDARKVGDNEDSLREAMTRLAKHERVIVYSGADFGILGLSFSRMTGGGHSMPFSRPSMEILIDYAESVGHPQFADLRASMAAALTGDETSAVQAVIATDIKGANRLDRALAKAGVGS